VVKGQGADEEEGGGTRSRSDASTILRPFVDIRRSAVHSSFVCVLLIPLLFFFFFFGSMAP
jgi:hypothetical protein